MRIGLFFDIASENWTFFYKKFAMRLNHGHWLWIWIPLIKLFYHVFELWALIMNLNSIDKIVLPCIWIMDFSNIARYKNSWALEKKDFNLLNKINNFGLGFNKKILGLIVFYICDPILWWKEERLWTSIIIVKNI